MLSGELAEEFLLGHAVFESFAAVDEDHGNFVGELAAEIVVGVDINFLPIEAAAAVELGHRFFDDFTKVAALARINNDLPQIRHGGSVADVF